MRTLRTVEEMRAHVTAARGAGRSVGLVPTMGAFHEGHAALMRAARRTCDDVVVSLFVNPTQFNEPADLDSYPRDEAADAALAAELGVDVLFAPESLYRPGHATSVGVSGLGDVLEGAERGAGHFTGVCTIVCKLLNIVGPDVAFFGAKDAQQVVVVRRMVRDLDMPVRIEVVPTVREPDGLAMSSRNVHLSPEDRKRAVALRRGLDAAVNAAADGERDAHRLRNAAVAEMRRHGVIPEYLAVVDPDDLSPLTTLDRRGLVAVAARVGHTRLIDNTTITAEDSSP